MRFRSDFAAPVPLDKTLHPVQLYESFANLLIFAVLYSLAKRNHRSGQIIGLYLVLYSAVRFVIEFFRVHEQNTIASLSLTQWIAAALFALGIGILSFRGGTAAIREPASLTG